MPQNDSRGNRAPSRRLPRKRRPEDIKPLNSTASLLQIFKNLSPLISSEVLNSYYAYNYAMPREKIIDRINVTVLGTAKKVLTNFQEKGDYSSQGDALSDLLLDYERLQQRVKELETKVKDIGGDP